MGYYEYLVLEYIVMQQHSSEWFTEWMVLKKTSKIQNTVYSMFIFMLKMCMLVKALRLTKTGHPNQTELTEEENHRPIFLTSRGIKLNKILANWI